MKHESGGTAWLVENSFGAVEISKIKYTNRTAKSYTGVERIETDLPERWRPCYISTRQPEHRVFATYPEAWRAAVKRLRQAEQSAARNHKEALQWLEHAWQDLGVEPKEKKTRKRTRS